MKTSTLLKHIKNEAKYIRDNAPEEGLERLNRFLKTYKIAPSHSSECIYGVIFGYCFASEAVLFLSKAPTVFYSRICLPLKESFPTKRANFDPEEQKRPFTALELFINRERDQIPIITDYLLGKRKTLPLKISGND